MLNFCPKCSVTPDQLRDFSGPTQDGVTKEWIARCASCGNGVVTSEKGKTVTAERPDSHPFLDAHREGTPQNPGAEANKK